MAKRHVLILPLLCLCALSAFALSSGKSGSNTQGSDFPISAGGRIFYNGMSDNGEYSYSDPKVGPIVVAQLQGLLHDNHGFGIGGFFDAVYVEAGMDFIFGSFKPNEGYAAYSGVKATQFGFTILGKFPFAAGPATVFPLAGIDYQIFLSGEVADLTIKRDDIGDIYGDDHKDIYDALSLVVGAGLDYNLGANLYLRGEVLCNFKMESDSDIALKKLAKAGDVSFSLFTFGPRVSIGIGYRF
jgi:hypothetical protein